MVAVCFGDTETADLLMQEVDDYRRSLGWRYNHEFKFAKSPKSVVLEMLRRAMKYEFRVYVVYVRKNNFRMLPTMSPFVDGEKLYNWAMKELLCGIPLKQAKITIDGRSNKQYRKDATTYLRREVGRKNVGKLEFKFDDSVTTSLLQFADLVAGSVNRSMQPSKTDALDYIAIFRDRIVGIRKLSVM